MTLVFETVSVASPFLLFVTLTMALMRRILYSIKNSAQVLTIPHIVMLLVCAAMGYFIYFGEYRVFLEMPVVVVSLLMSLLLFVQSWSYRRQDVVEQKPEPPPPAQDTDELSQRAGERQASLDYMRMTAQAPGLRGGMKVETLERDLTEIKQRLIDMEEVQMMMLEAVKKPTEQPGTE